MDPRVEAYLSRRYPVFLAVEKPAAGAETYAAGLVDLPGCVAQGATEDEAKRRLEKITPAYFEKLLRLNVAIPEPTPMPPIVPGLVRFYDERTGAMVSSSESSMEGESVVLESELRPVA